MFRIKSGIAGIACLSTCLVGCGGSSGSGSMTPPPNASLVGLWAGTDANSGFPVTAIIDSAGNLVVIRSDGLQFVGDLQIAGNTIAATLSGYANFGRSFPDTGAIYGIGTLTGSAATAASISAAVSFTTVTTSTPVPGSWTLTPDAASGVPSALSDVTGNFAVVSPGVSAAPPIDSLSITAAGLMSGQGSTTGCLLQGTISTPDTAINEYAVSYTISGCTANYAVLNGVTFSGLGFANYATSPATLTLAVRGTATTDAMNGIDFGIISALTPI